MQRPFRSLFFALSLAAVVCAAVPSKADDPDRSSHDIDGLIRQLGDPSFEVRQGATERLSSLPEAIPALRRALKSDDAEIARRAESILEELGRREARNALTRLGELAKGGELDLAAELMVRRRTWDKEEDAWQVMTELAQRLIDLGEKEFGKPAIPQRRSGLQDEDYLAAGDFRRHAEKFRTKLLTTGRVPDLPQGRVAVRAEEVIVGHRLADLFVSSGSVSGGNEKDLGDCVLLNCVVIAGGNVDISRAVGSVIVCDGDFTATDRVTSSLIVARGEANFLRGVYNSRVITSGQIRTPTNTWGNDTQTKQYQPSPLGFVKWFDPASVGVVVEKADGGVTVTRADENKPFARAGLRAGDLAVAADGKKIDSPDAFRRLLRAKVVMGEELTLEVRRDGKPVKVAVDLAPPEPPKK